MSDALLSLSADTANIYAVLFDMLIIIAIGGLWLMWARNLSRQKNVEIMLATTSNQLEEASRHLESALKEIQQLQQNTPHSPLKTDKDANSLPEDYSDIEKTASRFTGNNHDKTDTVTITTPAPADHDSEVQKILRMHRLGKQAEQIASQLDLPLARVKLLLHLNEQRPV